MISGKKLLGAIVALATISMAQAEIYELELTGSGRLFQSNPSLLGVVSGSAIVESRSSVISGSDLGLYVNGELPNVFAFNFDGGGNNDPTLSPTTYPLESNNYPDFADVPGNAGFNTDTGLYEMRFNLVQTVDEPKDTVVNTMDLPSTFFYDPIAKTGYLMVLQCINKYNYQTIVPPELGGNGTLKHGSVCPFINVGSAKNVVLGYEGEKPSPDKNLEYRVNENGGIFFDESDPTYIRTIVGDLLGSQLELEFEMRSVPVPAAVWLFGSALLGLAGTRKFVKK